MARVAVCLALIAPAAGLVAPAAPAASTALKAEAAASLKGMSGGVQAGDPMPGEGPWDPIGFSKLHENIQGSEHAGVVPSQQWMREAEIKHGPASNSHLRPTFSVTSDVLLRSSTSPNVVAYSWSTRQLLGHPRGLVGVSEVES